MTKERIEMIREGLIPFVKKKLLDINYEGLGKSDAEEFEKDLNEVLDLASKALEQQPSEDCVSRKAMLNAITEIDNNVNMDIYTNEVREIVKELPPVTPTQRWIPVSERLPECEQKVLVLASSYRNKQCERE